LVSNIYNNHSNDDEFICDFREIQNDAIKVLGSILAWVSGLLYFFSRIPQIIENIKQKSVEGISLSLFVITIFGNIFYGVSVLLRLPEVNEKFFSSTFPYIVGSFGTIIFDFVILFQANYYRD
ncbi:hypothetical protein HDU92_006893, partial [Lobulomyces angularis]